MGDSTATGQRIYSPLVLAAYDALVLGLSCRWIWRCPARLVQRQYDTYIRPIHLDVGVGTGHFLDRCSFPFRRPDVTLLDLNRNSLTHASRRIARYSPHSLRADVLQPISLPRRRFGSIGMSFLLHCLPGNVAGGKWRAFEHLAPLLRDDGVLFGGTALGDGIEKTLPQKALMALYNRLGIFSNQHDSAERLHAALDRHFEDVRMDLHGAIALFVAWGPRLQ